MREKVVGTLRLGSFLIGCSLVVLWLATVGFLSYGFVSDGCWNKGAHDSPRGMDCNASLRGAALVSVAAGVVVGPVAGVLMIPHARKKWPSSASTP